MSFKATIKIQWCQHHFLSSSPCGLFIKTRLNPPPHHHQFLFVLLLEIQIFSLYTQKPLDVASRRFYFDIIYGGTSGSLPVITGPLSLWLLPTTSTPPLSSTFQSIWIFMPQGTVSRRKFGNIWRLTWHCIYFINDERCGGDNGACMTLA